MRYTNFWLLAFALTCAACTSTPTGWSEAEKNAAPSIEQVATSNVVGEWDLRHGINGISLSDRTRLGIRVTGNIASFPVSGQVGRVASYEFLGSATAPDAVIAICTLPAPEEVSNEMVALRVGARAGEALFRTETPGVFRWVSRSTGGWGYVRQFASGSLPVGFSPVSEHENALATALDFGDTDRAVAEIALLASGWMRHSTLCFQRAIGGFEVPAAGRPIMYLPENPTRYEVWHEMGHYIEYKNIGRAEYMSGFDPFRTAAREGFVWRQLRGPKPGMPGCDASAGT